MLDPRYRPVLPHWGCYRRYQRSLLGTSFHLKTRTKRTEQFYWYDLTRHVQVCAVALDFRNQITRATDERKKPGIRKRKKNQCLTTWKDAQKVSGWKWAPHGQAQLKRRCTLTKHRQPFSYKCTQAIKARKRKQILTSAQGRGVALMTR